MSKPELIKRLERRQMKKRIPKFTIGDTIKVSTKIIEGDKERVQSFIGTVIARKGTGLSETFILHRVAYGEGMERLFLLHSPRITEIDVVKRGKVRRAKLYYLRGTSGKKAKVKGSVAVSGSVKEEITLINDEEVLAEVEKPTEQTETASAAVEEKQPT